MLVISSEISISFAFSWDFGSFMIIHSEGGGGGGSVPRTTRVSKGVGLEIIGSKGKPRMFTEVADVQSKLYYGHVPVHCNLLNCGHSMELCLI